MAMYSIWLRDRRYKTLRPLKMNMSISEATTFVTKRRNTLNKNQELVTENQTTCEADMFFTKQNTITPNKPMWFDGNRLSSKPPARKQYKMSNGKMRKSKSMKSNKSKSKGNYNRMWRMKSKQLYAWLRNPKNGTKKDRRMASYILSTRKRS